ncbi:MAG TPA: quinolinate synthase NadA [Bacteroidales bacterium]|nr:quinolinate synthase NadA [Bacteroidales bacterium]HRZ77004.1 quinolinate synthase NadA [Bacteroidales bacterium]
MIDDAVNKSIPSDEQLIAEIRRLRREKNAVILAHYYQVPEIQDIADYIGDSLGLAQAAQQTDAELIVFAGVHFMAETAKILNPGKKVVIPDLDAGCSLADSCPPSEFKAFRDQYPDHIVISYINCSAAIKTLSDVICTSSNARAIVESFSREQKIIFAPDRNLGAYLNGVMGRDMVLWDGSCEVHDALKTEMVIRMKEENPDALLIAHPECRGPILQLADFIGSTTALLNFTQKDSNPRYIVATETGILHQMKKVSPDKEFLIVPTDETCNCNDCPYMKLNTLQKLYFSLKNEKPEIMLDEETIRRAALPMLKMMDISRQAGLIR